MSIAMEYTALKDEWFFFDPMRCGRSRMVNNAGAALRHEQWLSTSTSANPSLPAGGGKRSIR